MEELKKVLGDARLDLEFSNGLWVTDFDPADPLHREHMWQLSNEKIIKRINDALEQLDG